MSSYKKITKNYVDMLEITQLPGSFATLSTEGAETIQKDIPRTPLFEFEKNVGHFQTLWNTRDTKHSYTQGDMTGHVFSAQFNRFIQNENFPDTYFNQLNRGSLSFSYFDDEGIPCGFSLIYSKIDPTLFSAVIIRNTPDEAQKRTVTLLCREDMIDAKAPRIAANAILPELLSELHSATVSDALSSILYTDGRANDLQATLVYDKVGTINSNKLYLLQDLLLSKLLEHDITEQSENQCLQLLLFIQAIYKDPSHYNQFTFDDIQIIRNDPSNSKWLNHFKLNEATPGLLEDIRQWALTGLAPERLQTKKHFKSETQNLRNLETELNVLNFRRILWRVLCAIAILGAAVACIFFPPTMAIIALTCIIVPMVVEWYRTNNLILTGEKNRTVLEESLHDDVSKEIACQSNYRDLFFKKINDCDPTLPKPANRSASKDYQQPHPPLVEGFNPENLDSVETSSYKKTL